MKYEIGSKIRYFRELRKLSQKELASIIGVSNSRISNWEQGINRPDADTLVMLCKALNVSADELLDMDTLKMSLSPDERQVIIEYRNKPDLHQAVHILLGINDDLFEPENSLSIIDDSEFLYGEAAAYGGDSARIKTTKEKLKKYHQMTDDFDE